MDVPSSPLMEMFPDVYMRLEDATREDVDRLLVRLLPLAARPHARGVPSYAAGIDGSARLKLVRHGLRRSWDDQDALSARLDELVSQHKVRAIGVSQQVRSRVTTGFEDQEWPAVRVLVEHQSGLSIDFLAPLDWSHIRTALPTEPMSVDRARNGQSHRVWPASPGGPVWFAPSPSESAVAYRTEGRHGDLQLAVDLADHALRSVPGDDPSWPAHADELAALLAAEFEWSGYPDTLDRALSLSREVVRRSASDPLHRLHLAQTLRLEFERTGRFDELAEALDLARSVPVGEGLDAVEPTETRGRLLVTMYEATAELGLLWEATNVIDSVFPTLPPGSGAARARLGNALGRADLLLYRATGRPDVLHAALANGGIPLGEGDERDPHHPIYLRDYGRALLFQIAAGHEDDQEVLSQAHSCFAGALRATHDGSPARPSMLLGMAESRLTQFMRSPEGAASDAREALEAIPAESPERSHAHAILARALLEQHRADGELEPLRAAVETAEQGAAAWERSFAAASVAQKLGASSNGETLHTLAVDALLALAAREPAVAGDARRRALEHAEAVKSRLLTDMLSRGDLPAPAGVPERLARKEQRLITDLSAFDTAALAARDRPGQTPAVGLSQRAEILRSLEATWADIAGRGERAAEYVAVRRGGLITWPQLAALASAPGREAVVVSLFALLSRTAVFLVHPGATEPEVVEVGPDERGWRETLRRFLRELPPSGGADDVPMTWTARLQPLLDEIAPRVRGSDRVILVPHGPAHSLPWGLLAQDWDVARISVVPALALLDRLRRRQPSRRAGTTVIGNPTGDLVHAEDEAISVARALGVAPLVGPDATRAALSASLPETRLIHLATHAAFEPASPLDAHVLLADGSWSARDALAAHMDVDLAVLSGCETGSVEVLAGDELAGLSQAFMHAGARGLVVSLWPVDDAATADFMRCFHERRLTDEDTAGAIAAAGAEVRRTRPHPWYWAGFTAIGDIR